MKKEAQIAIVVLIGFLSLLWLEKPFREFLSIELFEERMAKQISSITVRTFLIAIALMLINKFRLLTFTGLNAWKKVRNLQAVLIAFAIVVLGIVSSWSIYVNAEIGLLTLFALSTLAVGIVEEFVFRGTIFPLMIKSFKETNRPLLIAAVLSSLMFGLVHFINIFSQPENIVGITSQVFFATSIGVFFCGVMVRTENILIPIILHALVNFGFSAGELEVSIGEAATTAETDSSGINWNSIIPTTIFFSFILMGGIYMISKTDKAPILSKLEDD